MRLRLVAALLLVGAGCSHAPPPTQTVKNERHDDWVAALKSDLDRIAPNDGFEGRVRVMHAGTAEIDRTFLRELRPARRADETAAPGRRFTARRSASHTP